MKKYFAIVMLALVLAACNQDKNQGSDQGGVAQSSRLSGTYTSGKDTYVFSSEGKVTAKNPHFPDQETTYSIENGKVSLRFSEGYPMSFTMNTDGSLTSGSNINYKKTD